MPERDSVPLQACTLVNQGWALGLMHDVLYDWRRFRMLNVIDKAAIVKMVTSTRARGPARRKALDVGSIALHRARLRIGERLATGPNKGSRRALGGSTVVLGAQSVLLLSGELERLRAADDAAAQAHADLVKSVLERIEETAPAASTTYVVDGTLVSHRFGEGSTYYLVIKDGAGRTIRVGVPHPACLPESSPFKASVGSVRAYLDARLRISTTERTASLRMRVHGVGFIENARGTSGGAPNGVELHPALRLEFEPGTALGPGPGYTPLSSTDRVFNWAEAAYPQFFPKPGQAGIFEAYRYRHYSKSGNYVATSGDRVIVHNGNDWNFLDVGGIADFLQRVSEAGY